MQLAFCLFKYFRFGGLARDFLNIANECEKRGHSISVFTMEWQGDIPNHFNVTVMPVEHWQNHQRVKIFNQRVQDELRHKNFDLVIGFNKMPGLDVYYAADPCYKEKTLGCSRLLYRLGGRYKYYSSCEEAVFSKHSKTVSLMISKIQMELFKKHYQTPDKRLLLLPPGISRDRIAPENAAEIRTQFRKSHAVGCDERILLMIGTAYKTKGLDRTIKAMSQLPEDLLKNIKLFVVGEDETAPFKKLAAKLNVLENIVFFGGREDVPVFLLGADLLLQPSYRENTGTTIIEAIVSGLPVLVSEVCGYAFHVELSGAGKVLPSPFNIQQFADTIELMLISPERDEWISSAHHYAKTEDLYSMPECAVDFIEQIAKNNKSAHAG